MRRTETILKWLRGLAFVLGGLVAVLFLLAAIALILFDAEAVKKEAARAVLASKHRVLKIDGDLSLGFWPRLSLDVAKLSLSERDSAQIFATLEKGRLSVALWPLLRRQLVVDTLVLDGLSAQLLRRPDGSLNIDDLLSKDQEASPLRFDVAGLQLSKAQLALRDQQSGHAMDLAGLDLQTGTLGNAAEGKIELNSRLTLDQWAAPVRLVGHYRFDLDKKNFAVDGLDVRTGGEMLGLAGSELTFLAGRLDVKDGRLEATKLELGAKGKRADGAYEVLLEAPQVRWSAQQVSSAALSIQAKSDGAGRHVQGHVAMAGLERDGAQVKVAKVNLELDSRQGAAANQSSLKLNLAAALSADLAARNLALTALTGGVDLSHPALATKAISLPLSGNLSADLARSSLTADLLAKLDRSSAHLRLDVQRANPPALGFALDLDQIDLDHYLPQKPANSAPAAFDFSGLKGWQLLGSLRIGNLKAAGVKLSNLKLELKLADGKLSLAPLAANLYQGSLAGSLELDADSQRLALRQTWTGVALEPLLKDALNKDFIAGQANLTLDLAMTGASVDSWRKSLNGKAGLSLKDGALKGINLAKSFRELKARISQRQDLLQAASRDDKTDFSELSASFRISDGLAHNDDLAAKAPFLRLTGSGDIDLGRQSFNYLSRVTVVNTSAGQAGKDLADLQGLTIPVRLTGPFQAPGYKLEFASLVVDAAKARVDAKLGEVRQELRGKAREAAEDALRAPLKDLLGR